MAKRGRKKLSGYDKYVSEFKKNKRNKPHGWQDPEIYDRESFEANFGENASEEDIKDIINRQKYGMNAAEMHNRRKVFEEELGGTKGTGMKWSQVKYMSHEEFNEAFKDKLSELYRTYRDAGYSGKEIRELFTEYVYGSV